MVAAGTQQVNRGSLARLISHIERDHGVDLSLYRAAYLERRVATRLRALDVRTYRQYADHLDANPSEFVALIDALTINVTDFFRDKPVWDLLDREVLKPMIERKRIQGSRAIRIWSAGCATGEEAYSLAMKVMSLTQDEDRTFLVSVFGTDLDPKALGMARRGVYRVDRLKNLSARYRSTFTTAVSDTEFEVNQEVRRHVRFSRKSLFDEEAPTKAVDLILCRNVFIYFDREQQERAVAQFDRALMHGGYLVLGRSEKLPQGFAKRFETINGKERIFRKRPA